MNLSKRIKNNRKIIICTLLFSAQLIFVLVDNLSKFIVNGAVLKYAVYGGIWPLFIEFIPILLLVLNTLLLVDTGKKNYLFFAAFIFSALFNTLISCTSLFKNKYLIISAVGVTDKITIIYIAVLLLAFLYLIYHLVMALSVFVNIKVSVLRCITVLVFAIAFISNTASMIDYLVFALKLGGAFPFGYLFGEIAEILTGACKYIALFIIIPYCVKRKEVNKTDV